MTRWITNLAIAVLIGGASGCATTGSDPRDPFETFNRHMFVFNEGLDQDFLKPVATGYKEVVPAPVRTWVRNFFANLGDLWIGDNNLLQGKPGDAVVDWARFAFNSTWGILGINDVATEMGLEKHDEDFGQTLGRWGAQDGAYVVWPVFGSKTVRDSVGTVADWFGDPVTYVDKGAVRWSLRGVRVVSNRADLLDASRILEEAALDKYVFQRDAYLQRRRSQIYDGNPPRAARDVPVAESEVETAPAASAPAEPGRAAVTPPPASAPQAVTPVLQPASPGAVETAIRMLESPAAANSGG